MSREKCGNPVKRLRDELGLTQVQFAGAAGVALSTVANVEGGKQVERATVEKFKTLAADRGYPDIAMELSSDDWQVRGVIQPGEILISQAGSGPKKAPSFVRDQRSRWHSLLDEILDSGNADAISAATQNLDLFARYVRQAVAPGTLAVPRESRKTGTTRRNL